MCIYGDSFAVHKDLRFYLSLVCVFKLSILANQRLIIVFNTYLWTQSFLSIKFRFTIGIKSSSTLYVKFIIELIEKYPAPTYCGEHLLMNMNSSSLSTVIFGGPLQDSAGRDLKMHEF